MTGDLLSTGSNKHKTTIKERVGRGRVTDSTDPLGVKTETLYHGAGGPRQIKVTAPGEAELVLFNQGEFQRNGSTTETPLGAIQDMAHILTPQQDSSTITRTSADNVKTTITRDPLTGNTKRIDDFAGQISSFNYDNVGRLDGQIILNGQEYLVAWSKVDLQQAMTVTPQNPPGTPTRVLFDGLNRPTKVEQLISEAPGAGKTVTTPDGNPHRTLQRDTEGRVISMFDSETEETIGMSYDQDRLASITGLDYPISFSGHDTSPNSLGQPAKITIGNETPPLATIEIT